MQKSKFTYSSINYLKMKKLALLVFMAVMLVPALNRSASAEAPVYTLSVNKSNGGFLSLFNLYGNVTYSELYDAGLNCIKGVLNCYGRGCIPCRLPEDAGNYTNGVTPVAAKIPAGFVAAVNGLIEQSESQFEAGILKGASSKKVMTPNSATKVGGAQKSKKSMYIYTSNWKYNEKADGQMTINLYETDASSLGF